MPYSARPTFLHVVPTDLHVVPTDLAQTEVWNLDAELAAIQPLPLTSDERLTTQPNTLSIDGGVAFSQVVKRWQLSGFDDGKSEASSVGDKASASALQVRAESLAKAKGFDVDWTLRMIQFFDLLRRFSCSTPIPNCPDFKVFTGVGFVAPHGLVVHLDEKYKILRLFFNKTHNRKIVVNPKKLQDQGMLLECEAIWWDQALAAMQQGLRDPRKLHSDLEMGFDDYLKWTCEKIGDENCSIKLSNLNDRCHRERLLNLFKELQSADRSKAVFNNWDELNLNWLIVRIKEIIDKYFPTENSLNSTHSTFISDSEIRYNGFTFKFVRHTLIIHSAREFHLAFNRPFNTNKLLQFFKEIMSLPINIEFIDQMQAELDQMPSKPLIYVPKSVGDLGLSQILPEGKFSLPTFEDWLG